MSGRILLAEDDRGVRATVEHTLLAEGYTVDVCGTVAEACALIDGRRYDLVLSDVLLPDGSGVKVADCADERGFKVVIVTGFAFRIAAAELERHDYLLKPVRREELLREVERRIGVTG
jgi:two-component system response regulator PilR (NtrC family)